MMQNDYQNLLTKYKKLKEINNELPTKFINSEDIIHLNFLFDSIKKRPKMALLGQSGSCKSTLINKIISDRILNCQSGTGAVTQYPTELIYTTENDISFNISKNDDISENEMISILEDDNYFSTTEYSNELLSISDELEDEISDHIDTMNNFDIPFDNSNKYNWKLFNKTLNGSENGKFHFLYENIVDDKEIKVWINVSPFIKKISFYINNPFLKNVTLVDLPGLYDKSELRTRKTREYLDNETDFIMIVERNDRAKTSKFIDRSLNNYIVDIIVKKQIPDIILVLTKIDETYKSSKEDMENYDSDSDDDDLDDDEIMKEFNNRLSSTSEAIQDSIKNNENLRIHDISNENINILFYTKEKRIHKLMDENPIIKVRESIQKLSFDRIERYYGIINVMVNNYITDIKLYVDKETIKEEEENKIKSIFSEIKGSLKTTIDMNIKKKDLLVEYGPEWNIISVSNEKYNRKIMEKHGLTVSAILRKLNHESSDGDIFNLVEDLSYEYIKLWKDMYINFIKNMNELRFKNIELVNKISSINTLKEINSINEDDIERLKKRIKNLFIRGDMNIKLDNEIPMSYEKYLEIEGLHTIKGIVRSNVYNFHLRCGVGVGDADQCRGFFQEILNIENNIRVKDIINKDINNLMNKINDHIIISFYKKIDDIFSQYYRSSYDDNFNIDKIKEILFSLPALATSTATP